MSDMHQAFEIMNRAQAVLKLYMPCLQAVAWSVCQDLSPEPAADSYFEWITFS